MREEHEIPKFYLAAGEQYGFALEYVWLHAKLEDEQ